MSRFTTCVLFLPLVLIDSWAETKLIGAAVLPHGDFAYDPLLFERYAPNQNATRMSKDLFEGSRAVGDWMDSLLSS